MYGLCLCLKLVHGSRQSVISQLLVDVQKIEQAINLGTAKSQLIVCELDTLYFASGAT